MINSLYKRIERYLKKEYVAPVETTAETTAEASVEASADKAADARGYVLNKMLQRLTLDEEDDDDEKVSEKAVPFCLSAAPAEQIDSFLKEEMEDSFAKRLNRYMYERDITTAQIYQRCFVDRKLISKITSAQGYHPSKQTVLALCFGLQLTLAESEEFLALAGYAFSKSSKYDLILKFLLKEQIYDIDTVNDMLDRFAQPCFGA